MALPNTASKTAENERMVFVSTSTDTCAIAERGIATAEESRKSCQKTRRRVATAVQRT